MTIAVASTYPPCDTAGKHIASLEQPEAVESEVASRPEAIGGLDAGQHQLGHAAGTRISPRHRLNRAAQVIAGRPWGSVDELEKLNGVDPRQVEERRPFLKTEGDTEKR